MQPPVVGRDIFQRAWPKKRDGRDDVLEALRLHTHHQVLHAIAFHLKHATHIAFAEQIVDALLVDGNVVQGIAFAVALFDQIAGLAHDGQHRQPKIIHLEQANRLQMVHLELRNRLKLFGDGCARQPVQRHILDQRLVSDHHARCMGAYIAGHPLDQ